MAKINNTLIYGLEDLPDLLDFLIGSKKKNGKTMNFSLQSIINLINGVNGKNVIQYKFFNETTPEIDYTTPGAFFTNNNQTDVNNFSSLLFNKKTLGNYDLTVLFDFLSGVGDLFIGIDNPSNPNNFFTLKVTSISNQGDYFIFNVEPYNGLYIGELSHESIYSLYWETKEWISQIDDINSDLDSKLDHGGYTGTGQELKNEIDAVATDLADNYYTKPEVDGKISSVYRYRGNVPNFAALPTVGLTIGDVYNAEDTDMNWAWTGTVWDPLGGTTDISGKEDKSNKQNSLAPDGTGQKYLGIDGAIVAFNTKLDKGTYTGNAGDLKAAIDAIFVPDQLISAVPPTRSVNTFTYPASGYTALISKTLRTNPTQFITTITAASTTNHHRVDLIYFKPDNTLAKLVGTEDLIIAPRPDVPAGSVGVSFINVFGNVIDSPTPITEEISIQNFLGVELFKITNYMRFQNVSFDVAAKAIIIDPLLTLAVYLDPINGNDSTGLLENSKKPFKTLNALLNALPATTGETYTIYITGGTINITRRITPRNLKFTAYSGTTLDFTNVMEDDGVTNANAVTKVSGVVIWTFENENISIINNYVGVKYFSYANNEGRVIFRGALNTLNWKSTSTENYRASINMAPTSNLKILNYYDSPQDTYGIVNPNTPNTFVDIYIVNYFCEFGRAFSSTWGVNLTVDVFRKLGTANFNIFFNTYNLNLKSIISTTSFTITPRVINLNLSGVFSSFVTIDLLASYIISGNVQNENQIINSYHDGEQYFKDFTGKVGLINMFVNGKVFFENVNITTETYLVGRGYNHNIESCIDFKGFNAINQINTSQNLFKTSGLGTGDPKPILLSIDTLTTNALTYGVLTNYVKRQSTFKEKLNEIVIRSKTDLINKPLSSSIKYVVDANLIFVSGEFIKIPAGGLDISGYGFDPSSISKNILNESIFISEVGGSGNLVTSNITYYPGLGSVFNLTDVNGSHAVELNDVNFQGVSGSSLGIINGYRQFTGTTCGLYGLTDGLTLEGNWSGFKLTNSNVIGFGASGTLFKKGASLVFSNRFYIDLNIQIATGSKICDFAEVNFTNDKSLQVVNCYAKINGVVNDATTSITFPNITPYSSKAYFVNNIGIKNSNNMPYGISTANMQTYADDTAAAAGGIVAIGDTYIESSTGYFKKRLT